MTQSSSSIDRHLQALRDVLEVLYRLRRECPWDRKQTWASLRPYTIEELYELVEALANEDRAAVREELGDVLMHIVFYARIAEEQGWFDLADVAHSLKEKLIRRHPHIFGDTSVKDADEVARNWEQIKTKEKKAGGVLAGVPAALPSIVKAFRLQEKAAGVGFDWPEMPPVIEKVEEELAELKTSIQQKAPSAIEEEVGDLLFSVINLARKLGVDPDGALERTNRKFIHRFEQIEAHARQAGRSLDQMGLEEMDRIWEDSKKKP